MITHHERLALMAGITLNESAKNAYKIKTIKIRLTDLGIDSDTSDNDQYDSIESLIDDAVENQDALTIEDWVVNDGYLVFYPMLGSDGEISVSDAAKFRSAIGAYVSNNTGDLMAEGIEEKHLTPAELKKREEIAKAMEKESPGMNMGKKMAIATAQAKRVAEGADSAVGWYVLDAKDRPVAGPMSELAAHAKCKQLGGDAKGCTVSYTSDYSARRGTNESAGASADKYCVKYKNSKGDKKISVAEYSTKAAAEKFLDSIKQQGGNGIVTSPVKEDTNYDEQGNVVPEAPLPQGLADIAQTLGFGTLDTRGNDTLDFKEVGAQNVKTALLAAYNLGKTQGTAQVTPAAAQPRSGGLPAPTPHTSADHQQVAPAGR